MAATSRSDYSVDRPGAEEERTTSALVQLGAILVGVLSPLIGFLLLRDRGPFLRQSMRSALNFQLTVLLASLVVGLGVVIALGTTSVVPASATYYQVLTIALSALLLAAIVVGITSAVCSIVGAVRASRGTVFRYPLTIHFIR